MPEDEEAIEVLVVDDETRLADLFTAWLQIDWNVATAYNGEDALDLMSDSVQVVLLDRRMPGLSGDEVLEAIREEGYDCRVVMITAVDPDFDIVSMGFDDYLVKPVSKDELTGEVETMITRSEYEAQVQEYYSLTSKKALLESEKSDRELADSGEYQKLLERVETLSEQVDESIQSVGEGGHDGFVGAFKDLQGDDEFDADIEVPDPEQES